MAIAASPITGGYYLVTARGNVYNYGDAVFRGSAAHMRLLAPIVAISH